MSQIVDIFDGTHQTPNYTNRGIKFVSVEDIKNLDATNKYISEKDYIRDFKITPELYDILMTRIGDIGTPAIVNTSEKYAFYVSLALFKCHKEILLPQYFLQRIASAPFQHELWKRTLHIAFPKKINKNEIGECKTYICSKNEQQKIANFLSLIDQRIEKQRQLVESLKKYKRGLFNKCFSKLNDYKYLKLGSFAKIYQPSTISQNEFTNGPYKVFGANGYIGNYDKYNHALPQVTVSCRGEKCGTVNFVDAYTWITGNSMVINIDECNILNKKFLYHCLSNQNLRYLISGSAQPQIVRNAIELHKIPCPNLVEQDKIATFLDQNENLIIREECKLSNLISYKRGLLQQMFI